MSKKEFPHGFLLSDAAQYAFLCQEVFQDIISFAAAIPDHLKPLFLIPIKVETVSVASKIAPRIASRRYGDGSTPTGDGGEGEADWFGTKTFKYEDNEPTVPSSDPGSIFETGDADSLTHHQEYNFDENIQTPTDTTFMEDVDITQYWDYPYRTKEQPVRHSFWLPQIAIFPLPWRQRLAIKPDDLAPKTPSKIRQNAHGCRVSLTSYDKKTRVFTFSVSCGNAARTVQASLSDVDEVALSCDCPFWRYNGPEFNADQNSYMLGQPFGTAAPPNIRDPHREYALCKHAYSVLKRLDDFVQEITEENWEADDEEILDQVDKEWDRLEGVAEIPLDEVEEDDESIDVDVDWEEEPEQAEDLKPSDEGEFPDYEVDLSELESGALGESEDYEAVEDALKEKQDPKPSLEPQEEPEEEPEDYEAQEEQSEQEQSDEETDEE